MNNAKFERRLATFSHRRSLSLSDDEIFSLRSQKWSNDRLCHFRAPEFAFFLLPTENLVQTAGTAEENLVLDNLSGDWKSWGRERSEPDGVLELD